MIPPGGLPGASATWCVLRRRRAAPGEDPQRDVLAEGVSWALLVIFTVALAACGSGRHEGLPGDPCEDVPVADVREVFRLGGIEADSATSFRREPAFVVDSEGTVYVLHGDLGQVAVFDRDGRFVRWIRGGRGSGPGEFTSPTRIGLIGDTLWIRNMSPPRISRFLVDGTHVRTDVALVSTDYVTTAGVQGVSGYLAEGRAWMQPDGVIIGPDGAAAPFMVGDRSMQERQTLFTWRADRGRLAGTSFAPVAEPPFHAVAPDGTAVAVLTWDEADPTRARITIYTPDGSVKAGWGLSFPAQPMSTGVRDSLVEAARQHVLAVRERTMAQGISPDNAPAVPGADEIRARAFLPNHYPPVRSIRLGIDSTIWLELSATARPAAWLALDGDGTPLYCLAMPDGAGLRQPMRRAVWGTSSGEYDVPVLHKWEVRVP